MKVNKKERGFGMKKNKCANKNCGREFEGRSKYCGFECSLNATRECIEQLRNKEGPIYEKWKARLKASIEHL